MSELSVVIPAFNEEERIAGTVKEVAGFLRGRGTRFEIVVVNDGSTDGTARVLEETARGCPELRVCAQGANAGKGEAVKRGIREARFTRCLFMDADNSTSISEWPEFERRFERGAKAVVASRHLAGSRIEHPQPFLRRFLGAGYRCLVRALFGLRASDFNCGFKAYETELARRVYADVRMKGWTFDAEAFCLLKRERVFPDEVPVRWVHHDKREGISPLRDAVISLVGLIRLKRRF